MDARTALADLVMEISSQRGYGQEARQKVECIREALDQRDEMLVALKLVHEWAVYLGGWDAFAFQMARKVIARTDPLYFKAESYLSTDKEEEM